MMKIDNSAQAKLTTPEFLQHLTGLLAPLPIKQGLAVAIPEICWVLTKHAFQDRPTEEQRKELEDFARTHDEGLARLSLLLAEALVKRAPTDSSPSSMQERGHADQIDKWARRLQDAGSRTPRQKTV
jgi:hypothetical protein